MLRRIQSGQSTLLADESGLGKTAHTLAVVALLLEPKNGFTEFLILCPTSALIPWTEELLKFQNLTEKVLVLDGSGEQCKRLLTRNTGERRRGIILVSFEMAEICEFQLRTIAFDLLVLDEAHRASNPTTRLYKLVSAISSMVRIFLTCTPYQNELAEFFALLRLLAPAVFLDDDELEREFGLVEIHRPFYDDAGIFDLEAVPSDSSVDAANMRELAASLASHVLARTKKQVLTGSKAAAAAGAGAGAGAGTGAGRKPEQPAKTAAKEEEEEEEEKESRMASGAIRGPGMLEAAGIVKAAQPGSSRILYARASCDLLRPVSPSHNPLPAPPAPHPRTGLTCFPPSMPLACPTRAGRLWPTMPTGHLRNFCK